MNNCNYCVARNSTIHEMDPRAKLVAAAALSIIAFWAGVLSLGLVTLAAVLIARISRLTYREVYRTSRPALPFIIVVFLLHCLFSAGSPILPFSLGPINVSINGVTQGGLLAWRLALLIATGSLLNMTTPPSDLARGLESLLRPVGTMGISSQDLALMISLALRFIPTVLLEATNMREAQVARGAILDSGNPARRLRSLSNLAVPLCFAVFRRCDELVTAMEARGYDGGGGVRTGLRQLSLTTADRSTIASSAIIVTGVLFFG